MWCRIKYATETENFKEAPHSYLYICLAHKQTQNMRKSLPSFVRLHMHTAHLNASCIWLTAAGGLDYVAKSPYLGPLLWWTCDTVLVDMRLYCSFFSQFLNFVWENQPAHCTSTVWWGWGERHGGTLQWRHIPGQGRWSSAPARGLGWARRGRAGVTSCKNHPSWQAGNPVHIHAGIPVSCLHSPVSTYASLKHQCSGGDTKKTCRVKLEPHCRV